MNVLVKGSPFASDTSEMTQPTIRLFPIQLTCTLPEGQNPQRMSLGQGTEKERPGPWGDGDRGDGSHDRGDG